jgi:hypothetical protein
VPSAAIIVCFYCTKLTGLREANVEGVCSVLCIFSNRCAPYRLRRLSKSLARRFACVSSFSNLPSNSMLAVWSQNHTRILPLLKESDTSPHPPAPKYTQRKRFSPTSRCALPPSNIFTLAPLSAAMYHCNDGSLGILTFGR